MAATKGLPRLLPLLLALVCLTGCGGVKRVPVSGTVMLDGKPLADGTISFVPDESKGNNVRAACIGHVTSGSYELQSIGVTASDSGPGVVAGSYKVILVNDRPGQAKIKVSEKFTNANKTPLSIEVLENPAPGAYDVKMTSK
jgi:hypothetical protein